MKDFWTTVIRREIEEVEQRQYENKEAMKIIGKCFDIKVADEIKQKYCNCGRIATRVYIDPGFGGRHDVCNDCYDIEQCQDDGYAQTGLSFSREEALDVLHRSGWKSHYDN